MAAAVAIGLARSQLAFRRRRDRIVNLFTMRDEMPHADLIGERYAGPCRSKGLAIFIHEFPAYERAEVGVVVADPAEMLVGHTGAVGATLRLIS